ncbi:hypothetical protein CTI14_55230, partial [Methylobacterium radiotolerans]
MWAPWYGIPFPKALERVLHKYATFSGRASRAEFWWWTLLNTIVFVLLNMVAQAGVERTPRTGPSGVPGAAAGRFQDGTTTVGALVRNPVPEGVGARPAQ